MAIAEINGRYYQTVNTFFEDPRRPQYKRSDKRKWQLRISLSRIKRKIIFLNSSLWSDEMFLGWVSEEVWKSTQYQVQTQVVEHVRLITMSSLKEIHRKGNIMSNIICENQFSTVFFSHHRIPCYPRCAKLVAPKLGGYWWKPPWQIEISTMGRWDVSDGIIDDEMVRPYQVSFRIELRWHVSHTLIILKARVETFLKKISNTFRKIIFMQANMKFKIVRTTNWRCRNKKRAEV